ncbi:Drug efflux protein [Ruminococcaceae bacterium BL-4]|nr:Drug efflux protein [Ruminococcaceae bacterium BL-4]
MMEKATFTKRQMVFIFMGLMASLLLYALDSTVVSTAMKAITSELNGTQLYSWPFTAYMLCSTVIIPISGGISDLRGHKPVFLSGIIIFLLGSVLCGLSNSMIWLIICRGIQGIGGGMIVSSVFTVVADLFPPNQRGKYTGLVTSMYGVASIIGPLAGGLITDHLGWRWIFFLNIPLGIIAACLIAFNLPENLPEGRKKADILGIATLAFALIPLLLAFSMVGSYFDWISVPFWSMVFASVLLLIVFGFLETKAENPVVSMSYFKDRAISFSLLMSFLNQVLMFAVILYLPYFIQSVMAATATISGMVITPMMIGLLLASNLAGQLISRTGKCRLLSIASFVLTAIGMFLLSKIDSATSYVNVILYAAITGFAIGINMPISNVNAQNSVSREKIGGITSSVMFFKNLGRTVGSAVLGAVLTNSMSCGFAGLNMSYLPSNIQALLQNPDTLTNLQVMKAVQTQVPSVYLPYFNDLLQQSKLILENSVTNIFKVGIVIALVSAFLMIFLKEAPIRKSRKE